MVDVRYRRAHTTTPEQEAERGHEYDIAQPGIVRALARLGLDVRTTIPADVPKITKDWLRSYRDAPAMRGLGNDIYYANLHSRIEELWDSATWLVATVGNHPDFNAGWLCGEHTNRGPILHYVYTRHSFETGDGKVSARQRGIAAALVGRFLEGITPEPGRQMRVWYTCSTPLGERCLSGRLAPAPGAAGFEYNPWLLWRRRAEGGWY
jgi:hypothetical protein